MATYTELNVKFLTALQQSKLDEAWGVSQEILNRFPGHPNATLFQQTLQQRLQQRAADPLESASESASDTESDDTNSSDESDDAAVEQEVPPAQVAAVAALLEKLRSGADKAEPAPALCEERAGGHAQAPALDDDDDDDDPFRGSEAAVAAQLEKLGVLTRAAGAQRKM